ncbi:acyl-CoA dehydrogenase [Lentzea roselyniae]|uniref:Acyl-CoA dehydrogenase n=1 Tax=Lentzea roselyniae TaxID=531940 RepID=A0ABP7CD27_9PSEU
MSIEVDVAELVQQRWGALLAQIGKAADHRQLAGEAVPREFFAKAGAAGLIGFAFSQDIGGGGADLPTWGAVMEELARVCAEPAFPIVMSMGTGVASVLQACGRPDLVEHYVQPIICGERTATLAFSEDADPFSMRTELRRAGDGYLLSGAKDFITGATTADVFLTYGRDEAGRVVGFLVHHDDDGVEVMPAAGLGFRTSGMGRLVLRDVPIAADRVIGTDGLAHAQRYLNHRRLILTCLVTGMMRALLARCVTRLRTTVRHGAHVTELPNVQAAIGRMHIAVETTRAVVATTLARVAGGVVDPVFDVGISAAKHFATEQAVMLATQAFRVLGGHAYYGDPRYGIFLQDCVALLCAAGTQELIEVNIGALVTAGLGEPSEKSEVLT